MNQITMGMLLKQKSSIIIIEYEDDFIMYLEYIFSKAYTFILTILKKDIIGRI